MDGFDEDGSLLLASFPDLRFLLCLYIIFITMAFPPCLNSAMLKLTAHSLANAQEAAAMAIIE